MSRFAYYNEIEPTAAAWLRELIKAGHIAPGEVDERSIVDVRPSDIAEFDQCHFFAGIGVWSYSLRLASWPDDCPVWTGSCPCQPFSAAGKGGGFDDERHLWPAFFHLIGECGPAVVFGEQVASKDADPWIDLVQTDMEALGYAFGAVPFPSAGVGAPHIRDRTYWVANAGRQHGERRKEAQRRLGAAISYEWQQDTIHDQSRRLPSRLADTLRCGAEHDAGQGVGAQTTPHSGDRHLQGERLRVGLESSPGGLDDTAGARHVGALGIAEDDPRDEARLRLPDAGREIGGLEYADGRDASAERQQRGGQQRQQPEDSRALHDGGAGPTNGLWRDADWLFCRDGKWRPVEPGTFPLVASVAKGMGRGGDPSAPIDPVSAEARVMRLRGYGNAINAEAAAAFIESYLETADAVL